MGSGLSMASVNKIKELANQREYSLALDIIDSQDLSKSLNPQFLRLCGEIFIKSKRYIDARKSLVMAHKIAPEAKRIIFDLIDLYTKMGYKELAEKYYNIYMYDAEEDSLDTKQTKYLFEKYNNKPVEQIRDYIIPYYVDNMDYDWSFEAYLLLKILGDEDDEGLLKSLVEEYNATFKNSDNCKIMDSVNDDRLIAESKFYNFNKEVVADDDIAQKEIRREEAKQLSVDEERIDPNAAEIIEVVDEDEKQSKGFFRKKRNNADAEGTDSEEKVSNNNLSDENNLSNENILSDENNVSDDSGDEKGDGNDGSAEKPRLKSFFKKVFSKKKSDDTDDSLIDDAAKSEESMETTPEKETEENKENEDVKETEETAQEDVSKDNNPDFEEKQDEIVSEEAKLSKDSTDDSPENVNVSEETEESAVVEVNKEHQIDDVNNKDIGVKKLVMQGSENRLIDDDFSDEEFDDFSDEEFDDFAAESDTIDDLIKKENDLSEREFDVSDTADSSEEKHQNDNHGILFEEVEIDFDDDEEELETDDFSDTRSDGFGEMEIEDVENDDSELNEEELNDEQDLYESEDVMIRETDEGYDESVEEPEIENLEAEEVEEEFAEEAEAEEAEEEFAEETEAEEAEEEFAEETEAEEAEEEFTEETEPEEVEAEFAEEAIAEVAEEYKTDTFEEESGFEETDTENSDLEYYFDIENEARNKNKGKKLDFPVFKSSLFPNYHKDVPEVENNFNEIMNDSKNKIDENFEKEAELQRETERLLASLGIDIGGTSQTKTEKSAEVIEKEVKPSKKDETPTVSRSELKESLKISSEKKNILKKMKEYR